MKKLFGIFFASLAFFACSSDNSSNTKLEDNNVLECTKPLLECLQEKDSISSLDYEFTINYILLKNIYLYANDELGEPEEYYHLETTATTSFQNTFAMYLKMSDIFTNYIPPEYVQYYFSIYFEPDSDIGAGIEINDSLEVTQVYANSPASLAGIARGDTVKSIDGIEITMRESFERMIKGEEGDKIKLGLSRKDSSFEVSITLANIILPTVFLDSVQGVPRIRITSFEEETEKSPSTSKEFENAMKESDGAKATIIDLRGNSGGAASECFAISEMLLKQGDTVAILEEVQYNSQIDSAFIAPIAYVTEKDGIGNNRYYVFLADSMTASCSEIFLLATTSNKQSPIIGKNTYGKAESVITFYGDRYTLGIASITNGKAYGKEKETYHEKGFMPDYETDDEDEAFAKAIEFIEVEQHREAGFGTPKEGFKKKERFGKSFEKPGMYKIVNADSLFKAIR